MRRLYPVDKARVNEFGYSYDKDDAGAPDPSAIAAPTTAAEAGTLGTGAGSADSATMAASPSGTGIRKRIVKV